MNSLGDYLEIMHRWTERIQSSPSAIERSVYEIIGKEYRSSRVSMIELRFNPMKRNVGGERDLDYIIIAALRGMERAILEYGCRAGLIFCLAREFDLEQNTIILKKAERYKDRGVIGIDLAGPEQNALELGAEVEKYGDLFERARHAGLGTTVHTGETVQTGAAGVDAVMDILKPDRIGHGIAAAKDPEVTAKLARAGDRPRDLSVVEPAHEGHGEPRGTGRGARDVSSGRCPLHDQHRRHVPPRHQPSRGVRPAPRKRGDHRGRGPEVHSHRPRRLVPLSSQGVCRQTPSPGENEFPPAHPATGRIRSPEPGILSKALSFEGGILLRAARLAAWECRVRGPGRGRGLARARATNELHECLLSVGSEDEAGPDVRRVLARMQLGAKLALDRDSARLASGYREARARSARQDGEHLATLRYDPDRSAREAAWRARAGAGADLAPWLLPLGARRRELAQRVGHQDAKAMTLALWDLSAAEANEAADTLLAATEDAWTWARAARVEQLGARRLEPWDLSFGLDVTGPAQVEVPRGITWSEVPGAALTSFVDPPGDVRVALSPEAPLATRLHELGHATLAARASAELPWLLRAGDPGAGHEAFAECFASRAHDPSWLSAQGIEVSPEAAQLLAFDRLVGLRLTALWWRLEATLFAEDHRDTTQIDHTWRTLVRTGLGIELPEKLSPWARMAHLADRPGAMGAYAAAGAVSLTAPRDLGPVLEDIAPPGVAVTVRDVAAACARATSRRCDPGSLFRATP